VIVTTLVTVNTEELNLKAKTDGQTECQLQSDLNLDLIFGVLHDDRFR
jgi:hypothetical protein